MLLDDFLMMISKQKFNFLYSIIVPLLSTTESNFVPICIHKQVGKDEIVDFLKYIKLTK